MPMEYVLSRLLSIKQTKNKWTFIRQITELIISKRDRWKLIEKNIDEQAQPRDLSIVEEAEWARKRKHLI